MNKFLFFLVLVFNAYSLRANQDSLVVYSLLEQAKQSQSIDSSTNFANEAMSYSKDKNYLEGVLTVAKHFGNQFAQTGDLEKSVNLYKELVRDYSFDQKQLSTAYNQIGIYHVYMGHYDSTETYFLKALKMREELIDSLGIGASLNNLGNVTMTKGDYDKAVGYFIKALKIREQIKDSSGLSSTINNLGLIHYKQKKFNEAISYYHQALSINKSFKLEGKAILILLNLGNIYDEMDKLDSSVFYYEIAIDRSESYGDQRLMAMSYGGMSVTQQRLQNFDLAKHYIQKALPIRSNSNDLEGQAILFNNLGALFNEINKPDSGIYYLKESLKLSQLIGHKETSRDNYQGLSVSYEMKGDHKKALLAHKNYVLVKDSMLNETTNEQIAEIETKYETEKKEKEIAKQKVNIAEQELKVKQRNYLLFGLFLFVIFIVAMGFSIYKQQRLKQERLEEENRLKDQISQVKIQNELHEERLRISRDLHDNIGSQLTFIISSVDNMKHLFKSTDEKLNKKLTDVSGFTRTTITQLRDTIWALNKDEISFEDLKARLFNYIENAKLAQEQTEFVFNSSVKTETHLNSIEGVNIYRIVQEAINNSMKYAAATKVSLEISENKDVIELKIVDDGIGFNMAEIQLGNGLENMKSRATAISAQFFIYSQPEKGTEIKLTLNKNTLNAV
jgi:signal transduction histidine kinase